MSTKTIKAASITNIFNSNIIMESSFTTLSTVIEDMENEDSDLIDSDNDDEENSHLQFEETDWFQGVN